MGDHSSGTALADRLARPTRMEHEGVPVSCETPIPIRSCSRRGLPCHPCHQERGGLLPHPFTLTRDKSRAVCFLWRYPSGFRLPASPGGRYPPPCLRGARTFLQQPPLLEGMACQRSPSRPIERGTYQRTTERAIPPVSAARTSQFSNNCAWLWPVQVRITTSWPCVIWRVLCV